MEMISQVQELWWGNFRFYDITQSFHFCREDWQLDGRKKRLSHDLDHQERRDPEGWSPVRYRDSHNQFSTYSWTVTTGDGLPRTKVAPPWMAHTKRRNQAIWFIRCGSRLWKKSFRSTVVGWTSLILTILLDEIAERTTVKYSNVSGPFY